MKPDEDFQSKAALLVATGIDDMKWHIELWREQVKQLQHLELTARTTREEIATYGFPLQRIDWNTTQGIMFAFGFTVTEEVQKAYPGELLCWYDGMFVIVGKDRVVKMHDTGKVNRFCI